MLAYVECDIFGHTNLEGESKIECIALHDKEFGVPEKTEVER